MGMEVGRCVICVMTSVSRCCISLVLGVLSLVVFSTSSMMDCILAMAKTKSSLDGVVARAGDETDVGVCSAASSSALTFVVRLVQLGRCVL